MLLIIELEKEKTFENALKIKGITCQPYVDFQDTLEE